MLTTHSYNCLYNKHPPSDDARTYRQIADSHAQQPKTAFQTGETAAVTHFIAETTNTFFKAYSVNLLRDRHLQPAPMRRMHCTEHSSIFQQCINLAAASTA